MSGSTLNRAQSQQTPLRCKREVSRRPTDRGSLGSWRCYTRIFFHIPQSVDSNREWFSTNQLRPDAGSLWYGIANIGWKRGTRLLDVVDVSKAQKLLGWTP